ncbi:MAG: DEAD/DEAH box helicase, partial [Chloroflexi bacterium]|nr:DEAD/DEAH box helicase [Chloroflexota bacterium]
MSDPLEAFSLPARTWFRETFGQPTPPQSLGWPPIQRGEHTLILAPTGSGKTLAAFLWGIDRLYQEAGRQVDKETRGQGDNLATSPRHPVSPSSGLSLLYVSPLKALNNDIERNLRVPLAGIRHVAHRQRQYLPELRVAVRTGDTPQNARLAMLKHPPHILITTPESLYLMLTGPRAREMFRTVRTVIVDEIHTMCGNKRGVHLSLSLERLQHIADQPVQRIGLSATQRPLAEVARFLGGQTWTEGRLVPRPVTIVDAGYKKPLDLQVVTVEAPSRLTSRNGGRDGASVVPDFRALPGQSIWPHVVPRLAELIRQHKTTLIFCNNRRLAERTAERLNEQIILETEGKVERGSAAALAPGGVPRGVGFAALGRSGGPIRAHHGSISKEARREMEEDLKAGRLPALVGTSSLELGIDIGSVDLVVQLQSPKAVAQGLQRVGRSGHLVGQTSVGRIFATHREDVMEAAAVARGMLQGEVEATRTPQDCLDVLAQQIVAMASVEAWSVPALYDLVRQSYAYRDLSPRVFRSVLEMLAGKYYASGGREVALHRELRPRIVWDRVHETIAALPGSRLLAVTNAGTIPDRGAFGAYLPDGKTKIGELDEEFIFETRPGDIFVLGTHTWRVLDITSDRVIVGDAAGSLPRMPFWRGDYPWREYELGLAVGRFRREVAERISDFEIRNSQSEIAAVLAWLQQECALDENSAYNVLDYVRTQMEAVGAISSDRTIVVESFQDTVGDRRLVVHSPFGGRVNGPWGLALASALRERTGVEVEVQTNDDGILLRFPGTDPSPALRAGLEPPVDIVQNMTAAEARERILNELPNSAVFGAQFRMNAARALLLPGRKGGKRTPFWLQRLKAKDLLAVTRQFADFPIVAETYRDCLRDVMDLAHLEEVLDGIA